MSAEKFRALPQASQARAVHRLRNWAAQLGATSFSPIFPIEQLTTDMAWADLVLHPDTMRQVQAVARQLTSGAASGLKTSTSGYWVLFCGPAGASKTLTTAVLSKYLGKDVLRVDISQVVSKYSSETEKNLTRFFEQAETNNWVLFFDEADALFGKRTGIRNAHDKYANQGASYFLQRLEAYSGLVLFATERQNNLDQAFLRRLRTIIQFPALRS
jgi:SpoVK/Ycf46/Vps4 family AAA+-type ATPase